jgi:DNA-binding transcriptional ArsR family regulator
MAGGTRCTVAVLALLLLASLPYAAGENSSDVVLMLEDQSALQRDWYIEGDTVNMIPFFVNNGVDASIDNDPSCGVSLQVLDSSGILLVDESSLCRGQSQTLDLDSGDEHSFSALNWDLRLEDGSFVDPGTYTVQAFHSATETAASQEIYVQTSVDVSQELEIILELNSRLSTLQHGEEIILGIVLRNPTPVTSLLPQSDDCYVELNINGVSTLAMLCFDSAPSLEPFEQILLGHVLLQDSSLLQGLNTIQVSLPSQALLETTSFTLEASEPIDTSVQSRTEVQLQPNAPEEYRYSGQDTFSSVVQIENSGENTLEFHFTDSCRAEMWVVNDLSEVVFDSRLLKNCNALELDYSIEKDGQLQFTLPDWTFTDLEGCEVPTGKYSLVAEIPEFHLAVHHTIEYQQYSSSDCASSPQFEVYPELTPTASGFNLNLTLDAVRPEVNLRWIDSCSLSVAIIDLSTITEVSEQFLMCNSLEGRHFVLPYGEEDPLILQAGTVKMTDEMSQSLEEGQYQMVLTFQSSHPVRVGFALNWPLEGQVSTVEQTVEAVVEEEPRMVSGTWSGLQTELGTCWMIETVDEGQILLSSALLGPWVPHQGWSGTYEVVNAPAHPACEMFQAPSVQVRTLEAETPLQESEEVAEQSVLDSDEEAMDEQVAIIVPSVIVVVASGSLLSMLFAVLLSNESLRIPSTAAGLWFLGLIGRTHETSDGRYQRGRLMGYLTANPGCHFRALMAALDMSNGQITHHLRILESEEGIWRRKDGRLVRYYPLTNSLHPGMNEDDLPVPPLSPDPNSLQGKILSLLDHDGPLGEFPTQAELANRLEKSQQLVSHHLRTLQKFGLVEKRKMGLKNRYKLTREAIFLLETNTDFTRED